MDKSNKRRTAQSLRSTATSNNNNKRAKTDNAVLLPPATPLSPRRQTRLSLQRVRYLGPNDEMAIVPPPPRSGTTTILNKMAVFDDFLKTAKARTYLETRALDIHDESVRFINGRRIEIYVSVGNMPSTAFDGLVDLLLKKHDDSANLDQVLTKDELIYHVKTRAICVKHIDATTVEQAEAKYKFENISIIVAWDPVKAQDLHMDALKPNSQVGMLLSDDAPGTQMVINTALPPIKTPQDMKTHLLPQMSDTLLEALSHTDTRALIKSYGNVLLANNNATTTSHYDPGQHLPRGTLVWLDGSQVHYGPASSHYRALIFMSIAPKRAKKARRYHADTQYSKPVLLSQLVMDVWTLTAAVEDRRCLLQQVVEEIVQNGACIAGHYNNYTPMVDFFYKLQDAQVATILGSEELEARMQQVAAQDDFCSAQICASVPNLVLVSQQRNKTHQRVVIYKTGYISKTTFGVELYFPDNAEEMAWEGRGLYTLEMKNNEADTLFDGTNGVLRDGDVRHGANGNGKPIKCRVLRK